MRRSAADFRAATWWNSSDPRAAARPRSPFSASRMPRRTALTAAWIDADHTFDPAYATRLGVDMERVPFAQPASAEQGLEIARTLAGSGAVDLVVVDSAAALVPHLELEAGIGNDAPGLHSRVLASGLRKLRHTLDEIRCVRRVSQPDAQPAGGLGGRRRDQRRRSAAQTFRRGAHRADPVRGRPPDVASAEKQGRREHAGMHVGAAAGCWIRRKPVKLGVPAHLAAKNLRKIRGFGWFCPLHPHALPLSLITFKAWARWSSEV